MSMADEYTTAQAGPIALSLNSSPSFRNRSSSSTDGKPIAEHLHNSQIKQSSGKASVVELITSTEQQQGNRQTMTKEPKFISVAREIVRTTLSPRAGSIPTLTRISSASVKTTFGKFRRSSMNLKAGDIIDEQHHPAQPTTECMNEEQSTRYLSSQQQGVRQAVSRWKSITTHPASNPAPDTTEQQAVECTDDTDTVIHSDFVENVHKTLDLLVLQLDSVDPKKLGAIRLGGELRGLLGKAQDEFYAYKNSFIEHANHVGVSIALQNFGSSLNQVFAIIARLQTSKFLLNKKFKREILFAFQEINSYYTSLFMELSMAVAKRSDIVLPLPSPVKPQPLSEEPIPMAEQDPESPRPETHQDIPSGDAICLEAHRYFFGHGKTRDFKTALALYQEAAALKNVSAMTCLGQMYFTGEGVEQDLLLAEKWLDLAVSMGCLDACQLLGRLLCEKAMHMKNPKKQHELYALALIRFKEAADHGHSNAQYELGKLLESGHLGSVNELEAARWYEKAAESNHARAESCLGRLLYRGNQVEKDITKAIHYCQRAAAKDDTLAHVYLGTIYSTGDGVKMDLDRAIAFLRKATNDGRYEAMIQLATILLSTTTDASPSAVKYIDREKSHDEAVQLLLNAGMGGYTEAFFILGDLLENSAFLKDKSAALRFYIKAADGIPCHIKAAKRVAAMYYSGIGTTIDKWKAHQYYSKAAAGDDADALNALGLMYEEGEGCDLNFKQAAVCYRKAVELNSSYAHFNLGCLLSNGKGVARNADAAQAHFQKAMALGYTLAQDFLRPAD